MVISYIAICSQLKTDSLLFKALSPQIIANAWKIVTTQLPGEPYIVQVSHKLHLLLVTL